jgi:hypothetical protein
VCILGQSSSHKTDCMHCVLTVLLPGVQFSGVKEELPGNVDWDLRPRPFGQVARELTSIN